MDDFSKKLLQRQISGFQAVDAIRQQTLSDLSESDAMDAIKLIFSAETDAFFEDQTKAEANSSIVGLSSYFRKLGKYE